MSFSWRNPLDYLLLDLPRLFCAPLLLVFRLRRLGLDGKPWRGRLKGGAIVVGNHTSFADPFVAYAAFWYRRMFYLAGELVMQGRVRTLALQKAGCIRIDRNISDIEAVRQSVDVLRHGKLLSMFPEGAIQHSDRVEGFKAGVILIALQAGVPIVPTYTRRPKHWYNRRRYVIGEPIDCKTLLPGPFPSAPALEQAAETLRRQMRRCQEVFEAAEKE